MKQQSSKQIAAAWKRRKNPRPQLNDVIKWLDAVNRERGIVQFFETRKPMRRI